MSPVSPYSNCWSIAACVILLNRRACPAESGARKRSERCVFEKPLGRRFLSVFTEFTNMFSLSLAPIIPRFASVVSCNLPVSPRTFGHRQRACGLFRLRGDAGGETPPLHEACAARLPRHFHGGVPVGDGFPVPVAWPRGQQKSGTKENAP